MNIYKISKNHHQGLEWQCVEHEHDSVNCSVKHSFNRHWQQRFCCKINLESFQNLSNPRDN